MRWAKLLFWLWAAPYLIALAIGYLAGFATALLISPIRKKWLDLHEERVDPPEVRIPIVREFYRPARRPTEKP